MTFKDLQSYLPFLVPVIIIQLILMITALMDLVRRPRTRGPKWVWGIIIVLVNIFGPIIYFLVGRLEE